MNHKRCDVFNTFIKPNLKINDERFQQQLLPNYFLLDNP